MAQKLRDTAKERNLKTLSVSITMIEVEIATNDGW